MATLVVIAGVLLWSGLAGGAVLRVLRVRIPSDAWVPMSLGTGLGAASLLVAALGLSDQLTPFWVAVVFLVSTVFLLLSHSRLPRREVLSLHNAETPRWFHPVFIICVVVYLLGCLLPPTLLDVIAYHLALPKIFVRAGAIIDVPSNILSYFPQGAEMLYAVGLMAGSHVAAHVFHLTYGVLTALLVRSIGRRHLPPGPAHMASLLFLIHPMVALEMPTALVDLALTFYVTAVVCLWLQWDETHDAGSAIATAMLAGMASAVKWTGAMFCAPAVLLIVFRRGSDPKRLIRLSAMFFLALLPLSPWLFRNFEFTGNPVFPMLYKWFAGLGTDARFAASILEGLYNYSGNISRDVANILRLPWLLIMSEWSFGGPTTPLFLLFIPCLLFRRPRRTECLLILFAVAGYLVWFLALPLVSRLLLPVFPILILLSMSGCDALRRRGTVSRLAAHAVLGVCLLFIMALNMMGDSGPLRDLRSLPSALRGDRYLRTHLYSYPATAWMNRNLPPDAHVLLCGGFRHGYYLDRDYVVGLPTFQFAIHFERFRTTEDVDRRMKALGITHFFIPNDYFVPNAPDTPLFKYYHPNPAERRSMRVYLTRYLESIFNGFGVTIATRRNKVTERMPSVPPQ